MGTSSGKGAEWTCAEQSPTPLCRTSRRTWLSNSSGGATTGARCRRFVEWEILYSGCFECGG